MRASQFEILERDLANALSQVKPSELSRCRGYVDIVLEEYDNLDKASKVDLNLVSYLNNQLSEHTYLDLSFFNLVISEILTKRIALNNEESNLDLVRLAIGAINYWKLYRDKHELAKKRNARETQQRNSQTAQKLNKAKHEPLNALVDQILKLYEPTISQLKRDKKAINYLNVARRIERDVRSLNIQPDGRYLLGSPGKPRDPNDKDNPPNPVGAIKRRLEKAVRDGDLKSIREYKKL